MSRLVTVAHGTRSGEGNDVAIELTRLAGAALGVEAVTSYVELQEPLLADALAMSDVSTVVVPLLLSRGYHTRVDLPGALESAPGEVALTEALGPSTALAKAQMARLIEAGATPGQLEAGATPGQPVVLVAAGSQDPVATDDLAAAAVLLGALWGSDCRLATIAAGDVASVVMPGDAVSTYLLAPGYFARTLADDARAAGASMVSDVLGTHPAVVDLICERYLSATSAI
jgi:sirohydrochlorin ferrochelatase